MNTAISAATALRLGQHLLALTAAAVVTAAMLFSLGAQADGQHADALLAQASSGKQACVGAPRSLRS